MSTQLARMRPAAPPYYTEGHVRSHAVDGFPTQAVAISSHGVARAIGLIYAGFGDGPETAAFIVRACNAHDELVEALGDIIETSSDQRAIAIARAAVAKVQQP